MKMHRPPFGFWLGFLLLACGSAVLAQAPPQMQEASVSSRPLTAQEGKAIVNAAWERDRQASALPVRAGRKPDCSHLTHEVYVLAGFPYPYASSFDLYAGIASFARVTEPQPGDLVVWRGHVGIVVDPAEHTFYSSVRAGLRTESYDAPTWRARGSARFYRYIVAKRPTLVLTSQGLLNRSRESATINAAAGMDGTYEHVPDPARAIKNVSETSKSEVPAASASPASAPPEIPTSILIAAEQDKPSRTEIASAVSELNSGVGDLLREQDISLLRREVIIYDDLTLDRAIMKGKHGSVQARIESRVTLAGERIEQMQRHETFRLDLVRASDGWEVLAPKNRVYVPRDVAIRMLAARLAALTQGEDVSNPDSRRKQAQIVRVLTTLLN